jgi:hypothetical protein
MCIIYKHAHEYIDIYWCVYTYIEATYSLIMPHSKDVAMVSYRHQRASFRSTENVEVCVSTPLRITTIYPYGCRGYVITTWINTVCKRIKKVYTLGLYVFSADSRARLQLLSACSMSTSQKVNFATEIYELAVFSLWRHFASSPSSATSDATFPKVKVIL